MGEAMEGDAEQVAMFGRVPQDQAFTFRIVPLPGRMMRADIIGKQITAFARLLRAVGDDIDPSQKFGSYLTGLSLDDDGAVTISVAVMPVQAETTPLALSSAVEG